MNRYLLYISGGRLNRTKIAFAHDKVRPTKTIMREALQSMLRDNPIFNTKNSILVPFAGSGIVGLDLHSNFNCKITFVESDKSAALQLRTMIKKMGLTDQIKLVQQDIRRLRITEAYDGLFLDPPYNLGWEKNTDWLLKLLQTTQAGWFVWEMPKATKTPALKDVITYTREYGNSKFVLGAIEANVV